MPAKNKIWYSLTTAATYDQVQTLKRNPRTVTGGEPRSATRDASIKRTCRSPDAGIGKDTGKPIMSLDDGKTWDFVPEGVKCVPHVNVGCERVDK